MNGNGAQGFPCVIGPHATRRIEICAFKRAAYFAACANPSPNLHAAVHFYGRGVRARVGESSRHDHYDVSANDAEHDRPATERRLSVVSIKPSNRTGVVTDQSR